MLVDNRQAPVPASEGLRERKRQRTKELIQATALQLFDERGFDATTVQQIADAVGVSHMTFYRYFPTKESAVLDDGYDPMIGDLIAAQDPDVPPVERVRRALVAGLEQVYPIERETLRVRVRLILATPALRARFFDQHASLEAVITEGLDRGVGRRRNREPTLATRVISSACASTVSTAVLLWGEKGGVADLPSLVSRAFAALAASCAER
jgi:AcrR family transcriptional regulator